MVYIWIATINGKQYIYFRVKENGRYKTYYLAPLHVLEKLISQNVVAKTSEKADVAPAEAKSTVEDLGKLMKKYKNRLNKLMNADLVTMNPSDHAYNVVETAATLEMLEHDRSAVLRKIWDRLMMCLDADEEERHKFFKELRQIIMDLTKEGK